MNWYHLRCLDTGRQNGFFHVYREAHTAEDALTCERDFLKQIHPRIKILEIRCVEKAPPIERRGIGIEVRENIYHDHFSSK